ncbi:Por secretion system C-terminal sorting domain-containing protein [Cruoricaptor ignavus]|uniref:Por secretion system C-terminal sorting domain-containing protein n=1 Tax=Cruoricaptor ignavus TaxID=1118202 RepID=A0A1M6HKX7_9FLAO|nr:T9SS type A sorting domain-containing protein [Cruoricaptor ignavus]SHJ22837.1 Por secretion system C-terminal sorting domain-containing protein [Cruoricaptor ignavus]
MLISVFNAKGTLVGSYQKYGDFDYSKLPKGIYLVLLELKNGKKERHLIAL